MFLSRSLSFPLLLAMDTVKLETEPKSKLLQPLLLSPKLSRYQTAAEGSALTPRWGQRAQRRRSEPFEAVDSEAGSGSTAPDAATTLTWFQEHHRGINIHANKTGSTSTEERINCLHANHEVRDAILGEQPRSSAVPGFLTETRKQQAIAHPCRALDTNQNGTLEPGELIEGLNRMRKLMDKQAGFGTPRISPKRPPSRNMGRHTLSREQVHLDPDLVKRIHDHTFDDGLGFHQQALRKAGRAATVAGGRSSHKSSGAALTPRTLVCLGTDISVTGALFGR